MNTKRKRAAALTQRCLQALFLVLFLALTISAGYGWGPAGLFTRFDPLAALGLPIAARVWLPAVIPGLAVLASALLLGRVFCGYACPMGATLDLARAALKAMLRPFRASGGKEAADGDAHTNSDSDSDKIVTRGWFELKYLALAIVLVTAFLGVNTVVWGAPLVLITRFYALLLEPALRTVGQWSLEALAPLSGSTALAYADIAPRLYSGFTFLLIIFGLLFAMELVRPRFWCRYFCPAGAALGLLGRLAP